jgi:hypothetical protein
MIDLPPELSPWSGLLGLFPPELAADLGRWVPRIALAVGPMRTARPTGSGDPDGFSGLARRGSYERLLLTEWLLADEVPDEFARRAAMGEHAFLQITRRSPARAASSVAIFDAGPDQLGPPRIAALAALIVLAERAERAGARFAWGILQEPASALLTAVSAEGVMRLINARTAVTAGAEDATEWAARAAKAHWEDAWLVGPRAGAAAAAWRRSSLEVEDVLDPERRALSVIARSAGAPPREIELELPAADACVRLLRDPFKVIAPPPRRQKSGAGPVSNLVFAANGTKILARGAGGEILSYPVPNSPHDGVGKPKRYRPSDEGVIAAVGWIRRGLVTLTVTYERIILDHLASNGPPILRRTIPRHRELPIVVPKIADPLSPILCLALDTQPVIYFLDARRALFEITNDRLPPISRVAGEIAAIGWFREQVIYVGRDPGAPGAKLPHELGVQSIPSGAAPELRHGWHLVTVGAPGRPSSTQALQGNGTFEACVGFAEAHGAGGLVVIQRDNDLWWTPEPNHVTQLPDGVRAVGVWKSAAAAEPEVIGLEPDRRTISFVGRSSRSLPRAAEPIVDVVMSAARPQLAYLTAGGEVVIHALAHDAPLARFVPEG